jgi:alkylated DNA repair protein (DNA oxidative demethylase)
LGAPMTLPGFRHLPGYLDRESQIALLAAIREVIRQAPFYTPTMPRSGKALSVRMTNAGPLGWVSDKDGGYRYQPTHPVTGKPWPPLPALLLQLWNELSGYSAPPEACLVNYYDAEARLGSHVDADEENTMAPVLSVSLGDAAVFHVAGLKRSDPKTRMILSSGDVVVLAGTARRAYHGIDRILADTSALLPEGGRINLTLRRVTFPGNR